MVAIRPPEEIQALKWLRRFVAGDPAARTVTVNEDVQLSAVLADWCCADLRDSDLDAVAYLEQQILEAEQPEQIAVLRFLLGWWRHDEPAARAALPDPPDDVPLCMMLAGWHLARFSGAGLDAAAELDRLILESEAPAFLKAEPPHVTGSAGKATVSKTHSGRSTVS
jgi:hypothetical protein